MSPSYADKRSEPRARVSVEVTVIGRGVVGGLIRDINGHGAYVTLTNGVNRLKFGMAIRLLCHIRQKGVSFSRQLNARVSRVMEDGVAVEFTDTGLVAQAVIDDLRYYAAPSRLHSDSSVVAHAAKP